LGEQIVGLKFKGQGHWARKCNIVFCGHLHQRWIDLHQAKTRM